MKKHLTSVLFLCLAGLSALAQPINQKTQLWAKASPNAHTSYLGHSDEKAIVPLFVLKQGVNVQTNGGTFDFGNVTVGNISTLTFTIENTGADPLTLTGIPKIVLTGDPTFTKDETLTTITVASGGTTTFSLSFNPTTAGIKTGQISIDNDDATQTPFVLNLTGTGVAVTPIMGVKQGATAIVDNGTFGFGNVNTGASSAVFTFTIENTGTGILNLTGTPIVAISGTNAAEFTVNQITTAATVVAAGNTTFTVTFSPASAGAKTALISIVNNSAVNPYRINLTGTGVTLTPVMNLKQGVTNFASGSNFAFINTAVGANSAPLTFTIENSGTGALNLTGTPKIVISGANAAEFIIVQTSTTTPVAPAGTTTFTVTFSPSATGSRAAQLSITNNSAVSPYLINLSGTGTAPIMDIKQGATTIADNGTFAFGNVNTGNSSAAITFTIENMGNVGLNLTGTPIVAISGTNAGEFTINQTTTISPVTAGNSTTFTVTFSPASGGAKTALLSIVNNSAVSPYRINLTGSGVFLTPVMTVKQGATTIVDNDNYAYGNQLINTSSSIITFTIENTGNSGLLLSGTPKIAISGANAADFTINQATTAGLVLPGGNTTFTVTFSPTILGNKTALLSITNNSVTSPYLINLSGTAIAAVMNVKQGATTIASGNNFAFGSSNVGTALPVVTFTIENTGNINLNLTGTPKITISGANAADFVINQVTTNSPVAPAGTTNFTITFTPSVTGSRTAQLSIASNSAVSPYLINLSGIGTAPLMDIKQGVTTIADNGTFGFGNVNTGASSAVFTFTIENTGTGILNLTGTPIVAISGANAAEFTVNQITTAATVVAAGNTTFTITFSPASVGAKTALIYITNNSAISPYRINLTGTGTAPIMGVKQGAIAIADNGTYGFGNVNTGASSATLTFTIENTGTGTLNLTGTPKIVISGANAGEFTVNQTVTTAAVAPAGTTTFTITFSPASGGAKTALISIVNNSAVSPYRINLTGTGITLAPVMNLKQGVTNFADNGTYNFGNQDINTSSGIITFSIENTGNANLILTGTPKIVISGADAAEFTVVLTTTNTPVLPAGTTTFTVTFSPTSAGAKIALLSIANNSGVSPYRLNLSGTGIFNSPVMGIKQGATAIADNGNFALPNTNSGENSAVVTFIIENIGGNPLNLTGTPKITISGANASEFTVNQTTTAATVAAAGTTTFTITFSPASGGAKTALISIANNSAVSPYRINLSGTAVPPVMGIRQSGNAVADNANFPFGNLNVGETSNVFIFTIENTGTGILNLTGTPKIVISGANASEFTVNQTTTAATVASAGNTTFTITFSPASGGAKTALISISNNSATNPYRINLSGTAVTPVMGIKQATTAIPDNGNYSFGNVNVAANSTAITFTIENTGAGTLNLSGTPIITLSGTNAGEFAVNQSLTASPVLSGNSTTFTVTFSPASAGAKTALISIANNSAVSPYRINLSGTAITPVMNIKQGATNLATNATFNFGNVNAGANSNILTFTIENTGTAALNLTGTPIVAISGANAGDFTVVQTTTATPVSIGGSTTFTVTFSPATAGIKTALLTFSNNSATNPYQINLTGTGTNPVMNIKQTATNLTNNATFDFGSFNTGTSSNTLTFTIENTGTGALNLTGTPIIALSGANAADFTLVQTATANAVAPNGTTTFTITFTPGATGTRTAQISLLNNDAARNPYRLNLTGTGTTPAISVFQGSNPISNNGIYSFGNVNTGTSSGTISFTIQNTGTGALNLTGTPKIVISGANAGEFTINQTNTNSPVAPNGTTSFTVTFLPNTTGTRTAQLTISNNSAVSPYRINLTGNAVVPVIGIRQNATNLSNNSTFDFGNVDVNSSSANLTFTIENTGTGVLNLNGNPTITVTGSDFNQFKLENNVVTTINPNGSTTFNLAFQPTSAGNKSIVIEITNTDNVRNPYRITITGNAIPLIPVLSLKQSATNLADNSNYDFGNVNITSSSSTVTFRIDNTGNTNLLLTGNPKIGISGANAGDFTINQTATGNTIGAGTGTTFTVIFTPSAAGSRTALLSITNNGVTTPYRLNLSGTGFLNPPVMGIKQAGIAIANNGNFNFGSVNAGTAGIPITFTIENTGQSTLNLTGNPKITLSGANATDFTIDQLNTLNSISQGSSTTFTVTFAPNSGGNKSALLSIANSDGSRNPYIINLTGTGNPSLMNVKQNTTSIASGGNFSFGNITLGASSNAITFTIENSGSGLLLLNGNPKIVLSGTDANLFSVSQSAVSGTVNQNGTTTFTVTFTPTTTGNKTAQLSVQNNSSTNPYLINLTGTGVILPSDMVLKQSTNVITRNGTFDMGTTNVNITNTITFTIENAGTGTLSLSGNPKIVLSGSAEFSVNQSLTSASVAPNGNTTFTITFAPTSEGNKTAQISIANNDANKNPFTLNLTGNGLKNTQAINFIDIPNKLLTDAPFAVSAIASSSLPVTYSVVSGPVSISGNTVTILGTGTAIIRASQGGNVQFAAAPDVDKTFIISKVPQTIAFADIPGKLATDAPFDLIATSGSGLPMAFAIVSGPATLAGNRLTLTGSGSVTVKASQTGNNTFAAAPDVEKTFVVNKASQTINFTDITNKLRDAPPFGISAIASSNLAVTFTVTQGDTIASVTGMTSGTVTLKGKAGIVKIKASQAGDNFYNPAPDVEKSFEVLPPVTFVVVPTTTAPPVTGATLPAEIKVNQFPANNIQKVELVYRGTSRATWKRATLTNTTATNFIGTVPVSEADEVGLEYYFAVQPVTGNPINSDTLAMNITHPAPGPELKGFLFGASIISYSLIAVPFNLTNPSVSATLEELNEYNIKKWRLFRYKDGAYQEYKTNGFDKIIPGEGYMLVIKETTIMNVGEGTTASVRQAKPFKIALKKGFNMIGNPYNLVISWDDVIKANGNSPDLGSLFIYNRGTFQQSNSLDKFKGGFVFAEKDMTLKIPVLRNVPLNPGKTSKTGDKDWVFSADFTVSGGELRTEISGLGMHKKASSGKDIYDEIGLPKSDFLGVLDLSFPHPEHFVGSFAKDIVQEAENHIWDFTVTSNSPGRQTSLQWSLFFADKKTDKRLIIMDLETQQLIETNLQSSYSFPAGTHPFRAFYGNESFLKEAIKPTVFGVADIFPNPFSSETTVKFLIPDSANETQVEISIYDMKGLKIKTLANRKFPAGFQELTWNATADNGMNISAGLYIVRVQMDTPFGIKAFVKKVMLTR